MQFDDKEFEFRVRMARVTLEVDTNPTKVNVNQFIQMVKSEVSALSVKREKDAEKFKEAGKGGGKPAVKGAQVDEGKGKADEGKGKADEKGGKGKDKGKKGGGKGSGPVRDCRFYNTSGGCKNGSTRTYTHSPITASEKRCYNCASDEHY